MCACRARATNLSFYIVARAATDGGISIKVINATANYLQHMNARPFINTNLWSIKYLLINARAAELTRSRAHSLMSIRQHVLMVPSVRHATRARACHPGKSSFSMLSWATNWKFCTNVAIKGTQSQ